MDSRCKGPADWWRRSSGPVVYQHCCDSRGSDEAAWTIGPERMKGDNAHVVPLTADIKELLAGLPRFEGGGFLFSTTAGRRPINPT